MTMRTRRSRRGQAKVNCDDARYIGQADLNLRLDRYRLSA